MSVPFPVESLFGMLSTYGSAARKTLQSPFSKNDGKICAHSSFPKNCGVFAYYLGLNTRVPLPFFTPPNISVRNFLISLHSPSSVAMRDKK